MLLALFVYGGGVFAAVLHPNTGPTINDVDIYRHCLEDNDMLVIVNCGDLAYDTIPDDTINENYLGRYMNGVVELSNVAPYAYYNKGYAPIVFSMYIAAATPPPVWGGAYTVEFGGSPTLDWLDLSATTAMVGAVACDNITYTDETAASNNASANDMTLLPAAPAVNDSYYFGGSKVFSQVRVDIGTPGAGTWIITWEYYDGASWTALASVVDGTAGFTASVGSHEVNWVVPDDWEQTTVSGINAYWVRARVSVYTAVTTQPLGTQSWANDDASPPLITAGTLDWHATASQAATRALLGANVLSWARTLGDAWTMALITETAAGTRLSSYGEHYFTNAIPNLRLMCPQIFSTEIQAVSYVDRDTPTPVVATKKARWPFDFSGISNWFGLPSEELFTTFLFFVVCGIVAAAVGGATKRFEFGIFVMLPAFPIAADQGMISPVWAVGLAIACLFAIAFALILQKGAT